MEVLDTAFREASAAVVLLIGDDLARLREPLILPDDNDYERFLTPQPRQNVIFEAGLALGRYPDRTVLIQIGDLRPISDLSGRYIIRLDNSIARRQMLADQLRVAGCAVDTTGTDWHVAGNFDSIIPKVGKDGSQPESSFPSLSESAVQILRQLATSKTMELSKSDLRVILNLESVQCSYFVDELTRLNFIAISPGKNGGGDRLVLLLRGRDYLMSNGVL
jgi:hypothetical protein